jgi:hypothetical protein
VCFATAKTKTKTVIVATIDNNAMIIFARRQRISLRDEPTGTQIPTNQQMGNKNPAKNKTMVTGNEDSSSMTT